MKKEYDFSKGERGKFYQPGVELKVPVYLEPDVAGEHEDADIEHDLHKEHVRGNSPCGSFPVAYLYRKPRRAEVPAQVPRNPCPALAWERPHEDEMPGAVVAQR